MKRRETAAAAPTACGPRDFTPAEVRELRAIIAADWTRREYERAAALEAIHAWAGRRRGLLSCERGRPSRP